MKNLYEKLESLDREYKDRCRKVESLEKALIKDVKLEDNSDVSEYNFIPTIIYSWLEIAYINILLKTFIKT